MNIHEQLIKEGIRVNSQQSQQKVICPQCSHTRRNKHEPCLSVSLENDMALWHCHHCEWKGAVHDNIIQPNQFSKFKRKENVTPFVPKKQTLSDEAYSWLVGRGIDPTVITEMKLYTNNNKLCFPYFLDGKIVNIKHRSKEKRFHQEKDAMKTLYNVDNLKKAWNEIDEERKEKNYSVLKKRVIFVEGEMDVLSFMQINVRDVVSLPDGAPKTAKFDMKDRRFTAFEQTEWIWNAEEVVICTDNDDAGKALCLELVHRFGRDICKIVHLPHYDDTFCKDANDCLVHNGEESLGMALANAKEFPIEDLHSAVDYVDQVQNMYDGNTQKAISTGFHKLDEIYKIMPCTFNLITGIPNHGKSNFLDQILVNLAEQQDWKFLIYSPEHSTPNHIRRLLEKRCRKPFDIGVYERISQSQLNSGLDFLNTHFKFLEAKDEIPTIDYILKKAKASKQRYGIKGLVIDPFNQVSSDREANKREDEHIRDIIAKCQQFARNHDIWVCMVAHPHKLHRNDAGIIPPPDLYQVSGSAHWANMADCGLVVHRDFENNQTKIITRKIREQGVYGDIGQRDFFFNYKTRCYEQE
jgi:twinkle protein